MASVNVMKVTRANVNGLSVHLDNEKREEKEHSNKHINKELTKENYFIGCKDWNECKRKMDARTQEVDAASPPKRKVKDRIVAAMMEIPVPKAITDQGQADEFLQASFEQLQALYGVENVHGMAVHKDEVHEYRDKDGTKKTSLIHAHALVSAYATWEGKETIRGENGKPLRDENNKIRKRTVEVSGINGKNFVTRPMLNKLQNSFNEMCKEKFGMEYQTHGDVWNKTVEELKRESEYAANVVERMNEYEREYAAEVEDKFKHLEWENKFLAERVDERQKQLDTTKANLSIAKEDIRQAEERIKTLQNENKELEAENTALDIENTVIEQNIEFAKEDLENTKERVRTTVEKGKKKAQQLDIIMRAIPVKQKELEKLTEQVETAKTSQEQYKQQVNMLCDQIVTLEEEYARKEKEQLEKIEKELEKAEKAKEKLELDRVRLADEVERLAILQALSQELNSETIPKMSKQLVGSGTIVQAPQEHIEKAFEALETMKTLDLMAVKNKRREKQLIELKKQHEVEYQEKIVTARYDAQRQVAKERADERNQFRREKKELESKLEKAEYREKMVDKYMQQTGQAAKFEKWKVEQARRTVRNSIESLEEVAGFEQKKDYGLER